MQHGRPEVTALAVGYTEPGIPAPEQVLLTECPDCHGVAGQRCWLGSTALMSTWHRSRVEATEDRLAALAAP